jgi:hypothetical protein
MWNKQALAGLKSVIGVMVLLLCTTSAPLKAGQTETSQAKALADIAVAVVTCSSHPCLGDSERDVRRQLHNKIVSDGTFYYSDLATAYPPARKFLSGVAEWDFDPALDMVSMKITDFRAQPSFFLPELERALPGCQMERDDDFDTDSPDDEDESEGDSTREWSCSAQGYSSGDILVEIYLVHGLLILEMGP